MLPNQPDFQTNYKYSITGGQMKRESLMNCPFCGNFKDLGIYFNDQGNPYVYCGECGSQGAIASISDDDIYKAIDKWNRRSK